MPQTTQTLECTSSAAQIILSLVPIVGIVFGSALFFFFLFWQYKLRRELVLRGQYQSRIWEHLRILSLLVGSVSSLVGLTLSLLFFGVNGISYLLLGGLIPLSAGIGLILFYYLAPWGKSK
ncbi:MAG: hypothetical protein NZM25_03940 [Leptospiraceae bacterium]|nr:hypothetical protein [Leptospiraceae bacterium]MDW8306137.1 hypothetical protein [Leptospiraceae bacterium]